jgi:hypothetical protein
VIELAGFHIDEIGAREGSGNRFAKAGVGGPKFWRGKIFSEREAVIVIRGDDGLRGRDRKRWPVRDEAFCFRRNARAGNGSLTNGRGHAELCAISDRAGGANEEDAMEVGFVVNFTEQWFDATGADAGPNEGDFAGFEQCVAAIGMNRARRAENRSDGSVELAGVFTAAKDGVSFDGAEGELGVRPAAR